MRIERPTPDHVDEVLELLQASDRAVFGDSDWTEGELRDEWEALDLERDAWLVVLDDRLAGVAHLLERRGERFIGDGYVHPDHVGRGVGSRVLEVLEARALELVADEPAAERVVLQCAHLAGDDRAPRLFAGRGFVYTRSAFRMVVDVTGHERAPVWPRGIELRPFDVERHGRLLHAALEEAFREERGHVAHPFEEWRRDTLDWRGFEPSLVPIAWDRRSDEIAGFSLNFPKRMGEWGWIGSLGVRPAWRRRGLGLALLHESFGRFREGGETMAALGVDTENPTGAVRLYERAGMRVFWRADVWEKELRPGG